MLQDVRVIQRHLVYAVGLAADICTDQVRHSWSLWLWRCLHQTGRLRAVAIVTRSLGGTVYVLSSAVACAWHLPLIIFVVATTSFSMYVGCTYQAWNVGAKLRWPAAQLATLDRCPNQRMLPFLSTLRPPEFDSLWCNRTFIIVVPLSLVRRIRSKISQFGSPVVAQPIILYRVTLDAVEC